jgi:hypothetical protein
MPGLTLDAGALIAYERGDRRVDLLIKKALRDDDARIAIPAGVVAQVWRDGRRQAQLATLLALDEVEIVAFDGRAAREAGQLCGLTRTSDVVDASVVLCARHRRHAIVTSDPDDLARLAPSAVLFEV